MNATNEHKRAQTLGLANFYRLIMDIVEWDLKRTTNIIGCRYFRFKSGADAHLGPVSQLLFIEIECQTCKVTAW